MKQLLKAAAALAVCVGFALPASAPAPRTSDSGGCLPRTGSKDRFSIPPGNRCRGPASKCFVWSRTVRP